MKVGFLYPEIGGIYEGLQELGTQIAKEHDMECLVTNSLDEIRTHILAQNLSRVIIVFGGMNISSHEAQKVLQREHPSLTVVTIEAPHWNFNSGAIMLKYGSVPTTFEKALGF